MSERFIHPANWSSYMRYATHPRSEGWAPPAVYLTFAPLWKAANEITPTQLGKFVLFLKVYADSPLANESDGPRGARTLREDARYISRRIGERVTHADLESWKDAALVICTTGSPTGPPAGPFPARVEERRNDSERFGAKRGLPKAVDRAQVEYDPAHVVVPIEPDYEHVEKDPLNESASPTSPADQGWSVDKQGRRFKFIEVNGRFERMDHPDDRVPPLVAGERF